MMTRANCTWLRVILAALPASVAVLMLYLAHEFATSRPHQRSFLGWHQFDAIPLLAVAGVALWITSRVLSARANAQGDVLPAWAFLLVGIATSCAAIRLSLEERQVTSLDLYDRVQGQIVRSQVTRSGGDEVGLIYFACVAACTLWAFALARARAAKNRRREHGASIAESPAVR